MVKTTLFYKTRWQVYSMYLLHTIILQSIAIYCNLFKISVNLWKDLGTSCCSVSDFIAGILDAAPFCNYAAYIIQQVCMLLDIL